MPNLFPENAYVLLDGEIEKRYADENGIVTIRSTQALSGVVGGKNSTITRFNLSASTIDTSDDVGVDIPIRTFMISLDYGELTNASISITGEVGGHDVVNGTVNVANGNLIQVSIVADNCKTIEDELEETVVNTEHTYTLQFQFLRTFNILLDGVTVPTNAYIQVTGEVDPRFADENGVVAFRTSDAISGVVNSDDVGVLPTNFNYSIITEDTTHNIILYTPYVFADPMVQSIVLANWDNNTDGVITRQEIEAITNLNLKFRGNEDIISFNELQDFNGLKSIRTGEFKDCTSLTSITLPNSLTYIGVEAFSGCSKITGDLVIPPDVTYIGHIAFSGCSKITGNVIIPIGVTKIDNLVFHNCSSLTGLTLHNGITSIGYVAFSGCSNLTGDLVIPPDVTYIGEGAFLNCSKITGTLIIPTGITSIEGSAFMNCSSLTGLTLHNGITSMGISAFARCSKIAGTLVIPTGVISIGPSAFQGCSSLTGLTLHDDMISISNGAFQYCSKITGTLVIPTSVRNIDAGAFQNCSSLTGLTLHNDITVIGANAFDSCNKITGTLVIPTGVTAILDNTFKNCSSLTGLILHNGITSINILAFFNCIGLTSITIFATTPPTITGDTFYNTNNCPIYIPTGTLAAYSAATNWSAYISRFVEA